MDLPEYMSILYLPPNPRQENKKRSLVAFELNLSRNSVGAKDRGKDVRPP
jgi:hypothetical protein